MVTVFGLGFVGLTTALGFSQMGYKVFGIDVDSDRRNLIASGDIPFLEPGLKEALMDNLNKNFFVADDIKNAISESEFIFYCVGTPYSEDGSADLSFLFSAIDMTISSISDNKKRILVVKSTVPPGTVSERVESYVDSKGDIKNQLILANNPEFLREGHCWDDFMNADRIVIGCDSDFGKERLTELYQPFGIPIFVVTPNTGEYIKYLSNTLLATMISFSNEMAEAADAIGDVEIGKAFRILHLDKRWNGCDMTSYVYPGCGYGGYCLPKDTNAFKASMASRGYNTKMLAQTISINDNRARYIAEMITKNIASNQSIGILGLSFKPNSDDVRDTPVYHVITELNKIGYKNICAYDPVAMEEFAKHYPEVELQYVSSTEDILSDSDVIVILTAWEEFKSLDGYEQKPIFDCRYMLSQI